MDKIPNIGNQDPTPNSEQSPGEEEINASEKYEGVETLEYDLKDVGNVEHAIDNMIKLARETGQDVVGTFGDIRLYANPNSRFRDVLELYNNDGEGESKEALGTFYPLKEFGDFMDVAKAMLEILSTTSEERIYTNFRNVNVTATRDSTFDDIMDQFAAKVTENDEAEMTYNIEENPNNPDTLIYKWGDANENFGDVVNRLARIAYRSDKNVETVFMNVPLVITEGSTPQEMWSAYIDGQDEYARERGDLFPSEGFWDFGDLAIEMLEETKTTGEDMYTIFEGIHVLAKPNSTFEGIMGQYHRKLRERNEAKGLV